MVMAFSGWNDAGEAATGAIESLMNAWLDIPFEISPVLIGEIDPEDFYDFQVNRPQVATDESDNRSVTWPTTRIFSLTLAHLPQDLIIVQGVEPSMRWKSFTRELLDLADDLEVSKILTLGSLLADIPHTRPFTATATAANPSIAKRLNVETSRYAGSTGILGIIHDGCVRRGIDSLSLWIPVPHYASNAPSPKAALALIHALEDYLQITVAQDELAAQSDAWEIEVDELAKQDTDISDYVKTLEESKDAQDIPDISGEMIAKEFERYLRRRTQD